MNVEPTVDPPLLVIGTHNAKKGVELVELLAPHGVAVQTLAAFPEAVEVDETGATFAENARLKATEQAKALRCWVLADDSGLEVDALDGAPGVYSARFAGPACDDQANNRLLLEKLRATPAQRRGAQFVCSVALADPAGTVRAEASGLCRGRVLEALHGENGFGYDPLFLVREYHLTFGQLGREVKRTLSHRARALRAILPSVLSLVR
ncbi:RdgB/HAM1 family non-canonical purine NTP pyrophosphatase [Pirellulimonas nuda]|nr:RdgB/HAM1 family non-canonical purine NTP pyrophosphatase [Pirellulimonas nuda]